MEIVVRSNKRNEIIDISEKVRNLVEKKFIEEERACLIYVGHTTCGVLIQENYDSDVKRDILDFLEQKVPNIGWKHMEGNSDSHIKAALIGNSLIIPVVSKKLKLGRWQGIFLCEFDGPRERTIKIIALR